MNRKGFMMAELIVVSAIVLTTMVGLYSSYNKVYSLYKTRLTYYDINTLYKLGYYRDSLEYTLGSEKIDNLDLSVDGEKVYLINNNRKPINRNIFNNINNVNITFKEYVDFLENSVDFNDFDYMLIMEKCNSDGKSDCTYAYLEVYNN